MSTHRLFSMSALTMPAFSALAALALGAMAAPAQAEVHDPTLRDSFPIGDKGGPLCQVQATVHDPILSGMFERSWLILCRDASQPVGYVRKLSGTQSEAMVRITDIRPLGIPPGINCVNDGQCTVADGQIGWQSRTIESGGFTYHVEGFSAYADALHLALASVEQQRIVPGTIKIASTSVGGHDGFARTLAGSIDLDKALAEGYRRNHSGDYAEAAEFFEALSFRTEGEQWAAGMDPSEFALNRALQKSNMGEFAEAERLFRGVETQPTDDPVQQRLRRNFRAMHWLNQRKLDAATDALQQPVIRIIDPVQVQNGGITLTPAISASLNSGTNIQSLQKENDLKKLTPPERAQIIDAQAVHLLGTVKRLRGDAQGARAAQLQALADALAVRNGRVTSIARLRSQMLGELALAEEALGDISSTNSRLAEAVRALAAEYPETNALASARARYAAFLARQGQQDQALSLYRDVVTMLIQGQRSASSMANMMAPYYRILTERAPHDASAAADFFVASQLQVRPGVADTQAVLARELSAGNGEAARLFRQATTLTRDIERSRIEDARLAQLPQSADVPGLRAALNTQIDNLTFQQAETLSQLADYPQFRVVASGTLSLAELQQVLKPGEAYLKMLVVGEAVYMMLIHADQAQLWKSNISASDLEQSVDQIRDSISMIENGSRVTYPFDAAKARTLYEQLFAPVAQILPKAPHLIFEPDGAMLRLPINLLITSDKGMADYQRRVLDPDADPFDMREIDWLGRATRPSTAVSALSFRNARQMAPSRASQQYLGLGQNTPVTDILPSTGTRGAYGNQVDAQCRWDVSQWSRPISADELILARSAVGQSNAALMTGAAFTDTAVRQRDDLNDYRIIHFATHGLVTAPSPSCPARPALVTSFGDQDSDGLLTFQEIFDLKIDADLVILSACDTAAGASVSATREAGVTAGGGNALDGLVRSFIGAGGRSVIASHWPAPDDYDATKRLIGGLFSVQPGESVATALWATQAQLMADPLTSHPYYWAGFAIIGDGGQALLRDTDKHIANAATGAPTAL
ncbi:MAG TPA: CHAT domain-containing protein [Sphingopyxis sp.]|nr:CHAT domain-containing protein [Sphingopyxis sp.]